MTHKDRLGHIPRPKAADLELRSDPVTHAITWSFKTAADTTTDGAAGWMPTGYMEKVSRYIEAAPANREAIKANVPGKGEFIVEAARSLIGERWAEETVPGTRGTTIRSLKPFRETT